jgi:hypothetical protein
MNFLLALALSTAQAEDVPSRTSARVRWDVEGCSSAAALDDALAGATASPPANGPRLRVRVRAGEPARIAVDDGSGSSRERVLDAMSCDELARAVVVVVAMLLETESDVAEVRVPPRRIDGGAGPTLGLAIAGRASLELLPGLGGRLGGEASIEIVPGLALRALGGLYFPSDETHDGRGASFGAWSAGAGACGLGRIGALGLGGCASIEIGELHARGLGVDRSFSPRSLLVAASAAGAIELAPWPSFAARLEIGVLVPFVRPEFVYEVVGASGSSEVLVHRPAVVAPFLELALVARMDPS